MYERAPWRRAVTVAAILTLATMGAAEAETAVQRTKATRLEAIERARAFGGLLVDNGAKLRDRIRHAERVLKGPNGRGRIVNPDRFDVLLAIVRESLRDDERRLRGLRDWVQRRLRHLDRSRDRLEWWLETQGVFRRCPVPSWTAIADNFGAMVRLPKVPVHRHMGVDIAAPTGSPIVASFDGYASSSSGLLGGLEVRLRGEAGYIYHAHLSALGRLGPVRAGDVIGYVGSTGDATGPHDHLEWHPGYGAAVDPYTFVTAACVDLAG